MATTATTPAIVDKTPNPMPTQTQTETKTKLHGRAFYESIGSPKYILAPMVDQSEFAWRMLSRSFMPPERKGELLAYSPMLHARLFAEGEKYRKSSFLPVRSTSKTNTTRDLELTPSSTASISRDAKGDGKREDLELYLDGNPALDRPLFVQFCANDPEFLLAAAQHVAPYCDAVDLNLGCPQGIARKGHYGAFLQEDQDLVFRLINTLHKHLDVPVTAKIRILETKEATLAYAKNVLAAGASILTVHGRRREQKGHYTGLADWNYIRYLRENLPPETVLFANGNVLGHKDIQECLEVTGVDGVMSAEGNLSDPAIFGGPPPEGYKGRDYWIGKSGKRSGWRVDGVMRRYLDILHKYVLGQEPPERRLLFVPGDDTAWLAERDNATAGEQRDDMGEPVRKKRKRDQKNEPDAQERKQRREAASANPNFSAMQPHMFHLLRHFVARHTDVRDMLARSYGGDLEAYERVLTMVERRVAEGLLAYNDGALDEVGEIMVRKDELDEPKEEEEKEEGVDIRNEDSSAAAIKACKRPWWVVQPILRPMPKEAIAKGALTVSGKKEKMRLRLQGQDQEDQLLLTTSADGVTEASGKAVEQLNGAKGEAVKLDRLGGTGTASLQSLTGAEVSQDAAEDMQRGLVDGKVAG